MKMLTATCTLLLALPGSAMAQSDTTPGRALADQIFGSIEDNSNGADVGDFVSFGRDIFVSMDYDDSGSVNFKEFSDWDFGFNFIAENEGQERAFQTAQKLIFAMWDHNGDGEIARREYHKSMIWDFRRADNNDDSFLTRDEFLSGYVINLAYRAAITGQ